MDIVGRLNMVKDYYGLSISQLSKQLGIPRITIESHLKSKRAVSVDTIVAVLNTFSEISAEWLLREQGDMIRSSSASSITISHQKTGDQSIINNAIGTGAHAHVDTSSDTLSTKEENEALRAENKQLRDRCDKLTDKLLSTL